MKADGNLDGGVQRAEGGLPQLSHVLVDFPWSDRHGAGEACYLPLPRVAEMKLLKLLKINLMSKRLAGGVLSDMPHLSRGRPPVNLHCVRLTSR